MSADSLATLRQRARQTRRALPIAQQQANARALRANLSQLPEIISAKSLAAYAAVNGEMDPAHTLTWARATGKKTYLPIVCASHLAFAPVDDTSTMVEGKFGIPTPDCAASSLLQADALDAVLVPLLAFDDRLNRLGMGGGFYDRTFAFRTDSAPPPLLIGIAHACQKIASLKPQSWDIPMDIIVTEAGVYR